MSSVAPLSHRHRPALVRQLPGT